MRQLQRQLTTRASATMGAWTRAFLRPSRLPVVVLAALVVIGCAGWAWGKLETAVHDQLRGHLETILEAEVEALRAFRQVQLAQANALALEPGSRQALLALVDTAASGALDLTHERLAVAEALGRAILPLGFRDYLVLAPTPDDQGALRVLSAPRQEWLDRLLSDGLIHEGSRRVFETGEGYVSRPVASRVPRPDRTGKLRVGVPTMGVMTPVVDDRGRIAAVLLLGIDPNEDFTRILQQARFGKTGETYAFDADGNMLTQSRFDDELRRLGLLTEDPGRTSILNVQVRDPGCNLCAPGTQLTPTPLDQRPLTVAAQGALGGQTGANVDGYPDYRGVPVVGAWTWVPEMNLGVVTEVDVAEAYAPLAGLRMGFGVLVGLVAFTGLGTLGFMFVAARTDVALEQAEQRAESLGQYQIERQLGQGGMGTVFLARHALLRRPTALKVLADGDGGDAALRFEREVQATSRLSNPHTISIYDYGHTPEGKFFYAMEYLDGLTLAQLVEAQGPLPPARAVLLLLQVCESLAEAHGQNMIHRDVKPDNVLVCARGGRYDFVKVLDFGLVKQVEGAEGDAKLTAKGMVVGTPLYMPPEQVLGVEADARADVYAVGCVAYHLLTGSPPFVGSSVFKVMAAHCKDRLEAPSSRRGSPLPEALERLVQDCLEKERDQRPADAQTVYDRLQALRIEPAWTRADAAAWWEAHGAVLKTQPSQNAADPTGLSWLGGPPPAETILEAGPPASPSAEPLQATDPTRIEPAVVDPGATLDPTLERPQEDA